MADAETTIDNDAPLEPATDRRGPAGWPAGFVVAQVPNRPLVVAVTSAMVARLARGPVARTARALEYLAFGVFAYLELTDGANWLRRALGGAVGVGLVLMLRDAFR